MIDWLSKNAAAVQAFSALASLFVAIVLIVLTARYVRLTRDIARSSLAQVQHLQDAASLARRQNAAALEALSRRVRVPLAELTNLSPAHDRLRTYSHLTHGDVTDLEGLARNVSGDAVKYAADAAASLRVLLSFMDKTRSVAPAMGWMPSPKDVEDWNAALDSAPRMLTQLESAAHQAGV